MPNDVSYVEIGSRDAAVSRVFFEQVFGWRFHPMDEKGTGWFQAPTMKAGLHGDNPQPQLYTYFGVTDLAASIERVKAAGGQVEPPTEEPGFGSFCTCIDPQGVRFGLHQA